MYVQVLEMFLAGTVRILAVMKNDLDLRWIRKFQVNVTSINTVL